MAPDQANRAGNDLLYPRHLLNDCSGLYERHEPGLSIRAAHLLILTGSGHAALAAQASASRNTMVAAFSPIMIDGALVLPEVKVGMIEASATRNP